MITCTQLPGLFISIRLQEAPLPCSETPLMIESPCTTIDHPRWQCMAQKPGWHLRPMFSSQSFWWHLLNVWEGAIFGYLLLTMQYNKMVTYWSKTWFIGFIAIMVTHHIWHWWLMPIGKPLPLPLLWAWEEPTLSCPVGFQPMWNASVFCVLKRVRLVVCCALPSNPAQLCNIKRSTVSGLRLHVYSHMYPHIAARTYAHMLWCFWQLRACWCEVLMHRWDTWYVHYNSKHITMFLNIIQNTQKCQTDNLWDHHQQHFQMTSQSSRLHIIHIQPILDSVHRMKRWSINYDKLWKDTETMWRRTTLIYYHVTTVSLML